METLFFLSLLFGQLGSLTVAPYVTINISDIALVGLIGTLVFKHSNPISRQSKLFFNAIIWFAGVGLLSIIIHVTQWSIQEVIQSMLYLTRYVLYSMLFLYVVTSQKSSQYWLVRLYLVGVGYALLGIGQFITYPSLANLSYLGWDPYYYRVVSTLLDPNFAGILFVLSGILGIYLYKAHRSVWIVLGEGILGISLVLTSSRSSLLAVVISAIVYAMYKRQRIWIGCIIAFALVYLVLPKPIMESFRLERSVSAFARVGNWRQSIELFAKSPFLGNGFGNRRLIGSNESTDVSVMTRAGSGIDSSLLFVLVTTGMVGLVCYGVILRRIYMISKYLRSKKNSYGDVLGVWLLTLFVHSMFTNSLFYPWILVYIWIGTGVAMNLVTSDTKQNG